MLLINYQNTMIAYQKNIEQMCKQRRKAQIIQEIKE